jgi:hypothetical protein
MSVLGVEQMITAAEVEQLKQKHEAVRIVA